MLAETTAKDLKSFIPVNPDSHFPIQNLPYGVFRRKKVADAQPAIGVAIGDQILDLSVLERHGFFEVPLLHGKNVFAQPALNAFMALGRPSWLEARRIISRLLRHDEPILRDNAELRQQAFVPMVDVEMLLPVTVGDYTDFYASRHHATNVGSMFRGKENALLPNWLHLPVAYHGRASSVVVSGTDLHRPYGQTKADDAEAPGFGPCRLLDFELEMGCLIGPPSRHGRPIPIRQARDHIFGLVLVNDWSARDIQKWEYQPLGPFLSKNFGTSISPWVVTLEALEPFRTDGPVQEPRPLPYLRGEAKSTFDIQLEVTLQTAKMAGPQRISFSNFKHLYWSIYQYVAHHTISGCDLRTGDLLASGTISGPTPDSYGSLLEIAWRGTQPVELPSGEKRAFLQDGDRLTLHGWCQGDGYKVGFGEVTGRILPAVEFQP